MGPVTVEDHLEEVPWEPRFLGGSREKGRGKEPTDG